LQNLRFYIVSILLISSYPICAQHSSNLGRFSIDFPKACAPASISISEHDAFGDISRQYIYEQGQIETTDTFHVFENPGIYQIVQYLGEDIRPKSDTLIFEVTSDQSPKFDIISCSPYQYSVVIQDVGYELYQIKFSESDSIIYQNGDSLPVRETVNGKGNVTVKGLYENAFTNCSESSISFQLPDIQSIRITDVEIEEVCKGKIFLSFSIDPFDEFGLYRFLITDQNNVQIDYTDNGKKKFVIPLSFHQKPTTLCIGATQLSACDSSEVRSVNLCLSDLPYQSSNRLSYATYQNQKIVLKLDSNFRGSANVYKKNNYQDYQLLRNTDSSFVDKNISLDRYYKYLLLQQDTCGQQLDSLTLAPPYINVVNRGYNDNRITIEYEEPVNQLNISSSEILFYNGDSSISISEPISNNFRLPSGLGSQVYFTHKWTYKEGIEVYSNVESMSYHYIVYIPEAFSPNGDGINDQLVLFGLPSPEFLFIIYDRWGAPIYESKNNPVWDGRLNGTQAPEGNYTYKLSFETENQEHKSQVGSFTLLRK